MKILIAVDGSECGDVAVEDVAKRPWPADSAVRIISVAETLSLQELALPPRYREDIERATRHREQTIVERVLTRLRDSDVRFLPISSIVVVDSPKDAIVEEAERWGRGPDRRRLAWLPRARSYVAGFGLAGSRHASQMFRRDRASPPRGRR